MSPDSREPVTVAVLAKAPIPGTVKTRLVMMLGVDGAAAIQERFTRQAVEKAVAADVGPVKLWGTPDERHASFQDLAATFRLTLLRQPPGDLGQRMHAATVQAAAPTIVIGTDCPALTAQHLQAAADVLSGGTDAVVFPADDGGYVLIGLRRPEPAVFTDIVWGTDTVMIETRRRLTQLGLSWREPAQLWDVDRPSDVRRMRREGFAELLAGIGPERIAPMHLARGVDAMPENAKPLRE
jgi:rSAM/selenodomain-associated transferase 1